MTKSAIEVMKSRVSVRKYEPKPIPREVLEDIIDCGRLAPSGRNQQAWTFVVITEPERLAQLAEMLPHGRFIGEAGAGILVFCAKDALCQIEDACAATENIIIAAQAHGLGSCWINSYRKPHSAAVGEFVGCPDDTELVTILSAGYPAEINPRPKKELSEVLRWERFSAAIAVAGVRALVVRTPGRSPSTLFAALATCSRS